MIVCGFILSCIISQFFYHISFFRSFVLLFCVVLALAVCVPAFLFHFCVATTVVITCAHKHAYALHRLSKITEGQLGVG